MINNCLGRNIIYIRSSSTTISFWASHACPVTQHLPNYRFCRNNSAGSFNWQPNTWYHHSTRSQSPPEITKFPARPWRVFVSWHVLPCLIFKRGRYFSTTYSCTRGAMVHMFTIWQGVKANGPLVAIFNGAFAGFSKRILDTVIIANWQGMCWGLLSTIVFMVVENRLQTFWAHIHFHWKRALKSVRS